MTASREERGYRKSAKRCTRGEARSRLIEDLIKKNIGLRDIEEFVKKERKTYLGNKNKTNKLGLSCAKLGSASQLSKPNPNST